MAPDQQKLLPSSAARSAHQRDVAFFREQLNRVQRDVVNVESTSQSLEAILERMLCGDHDLSTGEVGDLMRAFTAYLAEVKGKHKLLERAQSLKNDLAKWDGMNTAFKALESHQNTLARRLASGEGAPKEPEKPQFPGQTFFQ